MRMSHAVWGVPAALLLLAACAEGPTAPTQKSVVAPSFGSCTGGLDSRTVRVPQGEVSLRTSPLPGVTVWATYWGGSFGLPFNIMQSMNYGVGSASGFGCLDLPGASVTVTDAVEAPPIPVPEGVDAEWWTSLSPREQTALLRVAQAIMVRNPGTYRTVGDVIRTHFQPVLPAIKQRAKIRAMDYYGGTKAGALLAGGIYGCTLYRTYQYDSYSPIPNADLFDFVSALVAAFGEAEFASEPLTGMRFGRNGVAGAALALNDATTDCGFLVFQNVNRTIDVRDPYTTGGAPPEPDR